MGGGTDWVARRRDAGEGSLHACGVLQGGWGDEEGCGRLLRGESAIVGTVTTSVLFLILRHPLLGQDCDGLPWPLEDLRGVVFPGLFVAGTAPGRHLHVIAQRKQQ